MWIPNFPLQLSKRLPFPNVLDNCQKINQPGHCGCCIHESQSWGWAVISWASESRRPPWARLLHLPWQEAHQRLLASASSTSGSTVPGTLTCGCVVWPQHNQMTPARGCMSPRWGLGLVSRNHSPSQDHMKTDNTEMTSLPTDTEWKAEIFPSLTSPILFHSTPKTCYTYI